MTLIMLLTALGLITLAYVFHPLFTSNGNQPPPVGLEDDPRAELAVRRDLLLRQLNDLEVDLASGGSSEALKATRIELESELGITLEKMDQQDQAKAASPTPTKRTSTPLILGDRRLGIVAALVGLLLAGGLYMTFGLPAYQAQMAMEGRGDRPQRAPSQAEIIAMVDGLAERLKEKPDDHKGWQRLARSQAALDREWQAMEAFAHLLQRWPDDLGSAISLADFLVGRDDQTMLKLGVRLYHAILEKAPNHPEALWFMASLTMRMNKTQEAKTYLTRLKAQLPPTSPAYRVVQEELERLATSTTNQPPAPFTDVAPKE
ncbi:MAG: hypothetical protein HQL53_06435 [Magnetococcales bacterium]|nr:hypothetical protein [Magnetococcales bacterium]